MKKVCETTKHRGSQSSIDNAEKIPGKFPTNSARSIDEHARAAREACHIRLRAIQLAR